MAEWSYPIMTSGPEEASSCKTPEDGGDRGQEEEPCGQTLGP